MRVEKELHSNGSSSRSDTTAGGETVGGEPTPDSSTGPVGLNPNPDVQWKDQGKVDLVGDIKTVIGQLNRDKVWCGQHDMHLMDCFYEHHKPVEREILKLHLPCGHLVDRPTVRNRYVVCDSREHKWHLVLSEGDQEWKARRALPGE